MRYICIVNGENTFDLANYDPYSITLDILSDDLQEVKSVFKNINKLEIYKNELLVMDTSKYNSYSSIQYMGDNYWVQSLDEFRPVLRVELTQTDIADLVSKLQEKIEPIIDIESMSLNDFREYVITQIKADGQKDIINGTDVTMSDGTIQHFMFDMESQIDIANLYNIIVAGNGRITSLPFHAHGEECQMFDAESIINLYIEMQRWITLKTTIINFTIMEARKATTKDELDGIYYGMEFTDEVNAKIANILEQTENVINIMYGEPE